jgi:hypothetical protein
MINEICGITPEAKMLLRKIRLYRPSDTTPSWMRAHGATGYTPLRIAFTRIPNPQLENIDASRQRRLKPTPPPTPPPDFPEGDA